MNSGDLLKLTSLLIVFVSLLFAFFLFTVKSKNKTGNYLLALFLLINSVDYSSFFYHNYIDIDPTIEMLRIEMGSFIKRPLLFLFVLSIIYSDFKLRRKHLLHLIPFVLSFLVLLPNFYLASFESKITFFDDHIHSFEGTFSMILAHIQSIFYIVLIFAVLNRYRKILLENYSISDHFNFKWLFQMNVILTILFVVATIKNIYKYSWYSYNIDLFRWFTAIGFLAFICWLVLKALYAPKIFMGIDSHLQLASSFAIDDDPNFTDQIRDEASQRSKTIHILKEHMISKEPYLNPELTIQDLANQLNLDVRELSILINHHLHTNFYEFISQYRIEKAKNILKNPGSNKRTILEILYQVGFNSKSSFNKSFKENTGRTPTVYRSKYM